MSHIRFAVATIVATMPLLGHAANADDAITAQVQQEPEPYRHVLAKEMGWLTHSLSTPTHLKTFEPAQITLRAVTPKPQIQKMFTRYRFYAMTYTKRPIHATLDGFPTRPVTINDVDYLYIISPTGQHYKTLHIGNKDDQFVNLLQDIRTTLHSESDVRKIWNLYLDLESLPNPDKYATIPGYEKGRQRERQLPIHHASAYVWDIDQGISEYRTNTGKLMFPGKPILRKTGYRIVLTSSNTIQYIKKLDQPVIIFSSLGKGREDR